MTLEAIGPPFASVWFDAIKNGDHINIPIQTVGQHRVLRDKSINGSHVAAVK